MSNPLEEYLHALEARDLREKAHADYVNAYTKLADGRAAFSAPTQAVPDKPSPSPSQSSKSIRPGTSQGKSSSVAEPASQPSNLAQLRADFASSQKARSDLEAKLSETNADFAALKAANNELKDSFAQLEKLKENLERRNRDLVEELKEKGKLVEEVQNEMVSLNLQLNVAEREKEKLKKDNEELTRRFMEKMEEDARRMNESIDRWTARR
ncbi:autophagy protein 16 [Westerdykella ornata]|uniref:Autophagy protein 16 n=1 Tax=Westerdykella ornata TaxID=318751 RepID=A0A6A6JRL7_WESOR|nr:autophagy protein 16 [Westerdykella ornata]KAF2278763.1 autophagy protein 16 [Westerdykella ornata]